VNASRAIVAHRKTRCPLMAGLNCQTCDAHNGPQMLTWEEEGAESASWPANGRANKTWNTISSAESNGRGRDPLAKLAANR
jgi:hypothetical protein